MNETPETNEADGGESRSTAGLARKKNKLNNLWAVLIGGPDDLYASPSKEEAERVAEEINKMARDETCINATVIAWQYDDLSHARDLPAWENIAG